MNSDLSYGGGEATEGGKFLVPFFLAISLSLARVTPPCFFAILSITFRASSVLVNEFAMEGL